MGCKERQRRPGRWPAGISCGLILLALLSAGFAGEPTDSQQSALLEQALAVVRDCMARMPAPWPDTWQREYLDTIREALNNDANQADCAPRIEVFRRGFARSWTKSRVSGLTQTEFDLRKAEIRWYCETLMAEEPASPSEKAVLKAQLRDLCDYAAQYLQGRFPFLKPECVEEAKKTALAEFEQEVESPLLPIFRKPLSDGQLRTVKANWGRLYMRWHFIWREVRYAGGGWGDLPDPPELENQPHSRFVKRCLAYLPRTIWPTQEKPPRYMLDAIKKVTEERNARLLVNRQAGAEERDLAMRFSNAVEQIEQWSFILTALLETATLEDDLARSCADPQKGGDAPMD